MKQEITNKDLRGFGVLLGILIPLIFGVIFPYLNRGEINYIPFYIGAPFLLFGLIFPPILKYPYIAWIKFGSILGWINTRIILGIVFYLLFAPIGILRRLFAKDSMNRKLDESAKTYRELTEPKDVKHVERPF